MGRVQTLGPDSQGRSLPLFKPHDGGQVTYRQPQLLNYEGAANVRQSNVIKLAQGLKLKRPSTYTLLL